MTPQEVAELQKKPIDEVIEITKDELRDYEDSLGSIGLGSTIDEINKEISMAQKEKEDSDEESSFSKPKTAKSGNKKMN